MKTRQTDLLTAAALAFVASASILVHPLRAQQPEGFDPASVMRVMQMTGEIETLATEGNFAEAAAVGEELITLATEINGAEHEDVLKWRAYIGDLHVRAGAHRNAIPHLKYAISLTEKLYPDEPLTSVEILSNLARCQLALSEYEDAAETQQRCLATVEAAANAPSELTALHSARLGMIFWEKGDRAQALPHYLRSHEMYESTFGPDHVQVAISNNNLGTLYMEMGELDTAQPLLEESLTVAETALGPDHPTTIQILNNLGELYIKQENFPLALGPLERSLAATEKEFGPDSVKTAEIINDLGHTQSSLDHSQEAAELFGRSLEILQKTLDAKGADKARILGHLASCFQGLGQPEDAESSYKKSIALNLEQKGPRHPYTRQAREKLAAFYDYMGRFEEAKAVLEEIEATNRKPVDSAKS